MLIEICLKCNSYFSLKGLLLPKTFTELMLTIFYTKNDTMCNKSTINVTLPVQIDTLSMHVSYWFGELKIG